MLLNEAEVLAKILISGDDHLHSKNYGEHINYPAESLYYFRHITSTIESLGVTHYIDTGDFSYGRFHDLEYRERVERELNRRLELTQGRCWNIKGNHDKASYGTTEYEFYERKGMWRPAEILQIGNLNINMVNFGCHETTSVLIENGKNNMVVTHGYYNFEGSSLPAFDGVVMLDNFTPWFGVDYIVSGHIHEEYVIEGAIVKDGMMHRTMLHYLPCHARPAYYKDGNMEVGHYVLLTVYADGNVKYETIDVPLLPLDKSFNLEAIKASSEKSDLLKIDLSEVVSRLDNHRIDYGNPIANIQGIQNVSEESKAKAISWLEKAMSTI